MDPVVRRVDCVHYPKCLMRACKHNQREKFTCRGCGRYVKKQLDFYQAFEEVERAGRLIRFVMQGEGSSPQDKRPERSGRPKCEHRERGFVTSQHITA
jgi:DNA-directed RNA polymerase subunit M/transcription elongation factor TFIIS